MRLILASESPRRRELLVTLGHDVLVIKPDVVEIMDDKRNSIETISLINATMKARNVRDVHGLKDSEFIVGADTVVCCEHKLFGKPKDRVDAQRTLEFLSNRVHEVTTSYCLIGRNGQETSRSVVSLVEFRQLHAQEIDAYLSQSEWHDKEGAYAIQGNGTALIRGVSGSITNVIGLPIEEFLYDARKLNEHREEFRSDKNRNQ